MFLKEVQHLHINIDIKKKKKKTIIDKRTPEAINRYSCVRPSSNTSTQTQVHSIK